MVHVSAKRNNVFTKNFHQSQEKPFQICITALNYYAYLQCFFNSLESKIFSPEKNVWFGLGRRFSVDDFVEKQLTVKPAKKKKDKKNSLMIFNYTCSVLCYKIARIVRALWLVNQVFKAIVATHNNTYLHSFIKQKCHWYVSIGGECEFSKGSCYQQASDDFTKKDIAFLVLKTCFELS